jgi:hypothetical protein
VVEQQPRVDEVEGRAGDWLVGRDVHAGERALPMAESTQSRDRVGAQSLVEVHADHGTGRADALGHQAHRLARTAARVQAAGARMQADGVEQAGGRGLPDAGLGAQALVLRRRAGERVRVGGGRHGRDPHASPAAGTWGESLYRA